MARLKNKRGINLLGGITTYIIIIIMFITILLFFVSNKLGGLSKVEEAEAKKMALLINTLGQDTEMRIDLKELWEIAQKEKYRGNIMSVNKETGVVRVQLSRTSGYEIRAYNKIKEVEGDGRTFIIIRT